MLLFKFVSHQHHHFHETQETPFLSNIYMSCLMFDHQIDKKPYTIPHKLINFYYAYVYI